MNAEDTYYTCKVCGKRILFFYPIKYSRNKDDSISISEFDKRYWKSVARFEHNQTHIGALDQFI